MTRSRDLLPLPLPFTALPRSVPRGASRYSIRRLHAKAGWQRWANEGVNTINNLAGELNPKPSLPSALQSRALADFVKPYKDVGKPPALLTPARAFTELCNSSLPYITDGGGPAPYDRENLSLPSVGGILVDPIPNLGPGPRDLVTGVRKPMLRSEMDAAAILQESMCSKPHVDPAFNSPKVYADFLQLLLSRELIEFQIGGKSYRCVLRLEKEWKAATHF